MSRWKMSDTQEEMRLFGDNETKSNFLFRREIAPKLIFIYFHSPKLISTPFKIKKSKKLSKLLLYVGVGTRGVGWPQDLPQSEAPGLRSLQPKISDQNRIWGKTGTYVF